MDCVPVMPYGAGNFLHSTFVFLPLLRQAGVIDLTFILGFHLLGFHFSCPHVLYFLLLTQWKLFRQPPQHFFTLPMLLVFCHSILQVMLNQ